MAKLYVALGALALIAIEATSVGATNGADSKLMGGGRNDNRAFWDIPRQSKRPVDYDALAIQAKYMKKASGPFGKIVDMMRKVSDQELAEADDHGLMLVRGLDMIQHHYELHYGAVYNKRFPYEKSFAEFKREASIFRDKNLAEQRAREICLAIDLYVAMDPTKCDQGAIRDMQTLIQMADLEWFMENNRWIRTPPLTNVQRHIAMNAYDQSQNCATGKKH